MMFRLKLKFDWPKSIGWRVGVSHNRRKDLDRVQFYLRDDRAERRGRVRCGTCTIHKEFCRSCRAAQQDALLRHVVVN